jgi:hypothetical protein
MPLRDSRCWIDYTKRASKIVRVLRYLARSYGVSEATIRCARPGIRDFAERVLRNIRRRLVDHSGLMLAARITLPHFSVSSAMSLPNSAGESSSTSPPRSASYWGRQEQRWKHKRAARVGYLAGRGLSVQAPRGPPAAR